MNTKIFFLAFSSRTQVIIYRTGSCGEETIPSPFRGTVPNYNIEHLYSITSGVYDYQPIDGWELLYKRFGTDESSTEAPPVLILYNRYESNIRIFFYVNASEDYNQAKILFHFDEDDDVESALLAYINHPEVALDKFRKRLKATIPNRIVNGNGSNACDSYWLFADIPVAYDPCTCERKLELDIVPILTDFQTINLSIKGGGTISQIVSGGVPGSPSHTSVLSNINGLGKGSKTAKSLQGFYNNIESIASLFDLVDFSMGVNSYKDNEGVISNPDSSQEEKDTAKSAIGKVDKRKKEAFAFPKWAKAIPKIGLAIDIVNFIIGGGKSSSKPKPTSFEADLNFEAVGDISGDYSYTNAEVFVPGSNWAIQTDPFEVNRKKPVYDNILGIFTLLETPKAIKNWEVFSDPSGLPEYETITSETKFKLESDIKYAINPASGLILDDISVRFVVLDAPSNYGVYSSSFDVGVLDQITNISTGKRFYKEPMLSLGCMTEYVLDLSTSENVNPDYDVVLDFANLDLYLEVNVVLSQNTELIPTDLYDPNSEKVFIRHTYKVNQVGGSINDVANLGQIKSHEVIGDLVLTEDMTIYAWSTIEITGTIITNGYNLTVIAGTEITGKISDLPDGVDLIIGNPAGCGDDVPEQTFSEISTFCNSGDYSPMALMPGKLSTGEEQEKPKAQKSYLKISPNPFQDYFKVTYSLADEKEVIGFLYNTLGERVKEVRLEGGETDKELIVDCADLGTGIYFLTIQTESDLKTVKLIKQAE